MPSGPMSLERQQELALLIIRSRLRRSGLPAPRDFRGKMGEEAKELGIDLEELERFYEALLPEILGALLGKRHVRITTSDGTH